MSQIQVTCRECGNTMLAATSDATGGLCVPCASGTRKSLGSARRRYEEFLERTKTGRSQWSDLVKKVHKTPAGFSGLSPHEKIYYAVSILDGEVWRGGIHTFFHNSSGDYYQDALRGLAEIGASNWAEFLQKSCRILFPNGDPPSDTSARRQVLPWWIEEDRATKPEWEIALTALEAEYKPRLEKLSGLLTAYSTENHIFPS